MAKVCVFLYSLILLQWCSGLKICGLEKVPKCSFSELKCIENTEQALRRWSVSPYARGYFLKPLNPLVLKDLTFIVDNQKFSLQNVLVNGLLDSKMEIRYTKPKIKQYTVYFRHNLLLEAKRSVRTCLKSGEKYIDFAPVRIEISDIITENKMQIETEQRCDGSKHMQLLLSAVETRSGLTRIIYGLSEQLKKVDFGDFGMNLAKTIGSLSTESVYTNLNQLFSIIDYADVVASGN